MKIALDWDDTYSLDPEFWNLFIAMAEMRGHEILIVTMRYEQEPVPYPKLNNVYYTSRRAKRPFMANQGIHIDVWIDDRPDFVNNDAVR